MSQTPLSYGKQYTKRETRINIHFLLWSTQFSQSHARVCCNMSTPKHMEIIKFSTSLMCDMSFDRSLKNEFTLKISTLCLLPSSRKP